MAKTELMLPSGFGHELVLVSSILYIKSDRKCCTIVTTGKTYTVIRSLRYFVNELPEDIFFRSHKSYLVSLTYVQAISKKTLFVAGRPLPFSPRARASFYRRVLKIG